VVLDEVADAWARRSDKPCFGGMSFFFRHNNGLPPWLSGRDKSAERKENAR
jgi:hypothetical protein